MNETDVKQMHVLILGQPEHGEHLLHWIDHHADVQHVDTLDEALQALRADHFDLIVGHAQEFLRLEDAQFVSHAEAVFDSFDQAVCLVSPDGRLGWANPRMHGFDEEVRERIYHCCVETANAVRSEARDAAPSVRGRRFSLTTEANEFIEVHATPVVDANNRVTQIVAVVWDTTRARRLQDKIDAIDRAGRELLSLDAEQFARLDAQERLSLLEQKIRRCIREILHFDNFEIRVLNKQNNRLDCALAAGMPSDMVDAEIYAEKTGSGICGYVAARGRSYICPNVAADPRYLPGLDQARSSLTVPLLFRDEVVGVANFESARVAAFTEDDRQFAEIFARYIALALHVLELLVSERHQTTGRLGSDVMSEITAPLNDILTDVESLVEDYLGHDDLRHRLRAISENAVKIRETIKEITSKKPGLVGLAGRTGKCIDPVLRGKRILVVDDEEIIRHTVRDVLIGYGCEVKDANDGAAAIELIGMEAFDLVLSDIRMPTRNGYEVFAAAKDANPDTPVILTTGFGYDPNHTIVRARREGLAAVLFKPFKVDQLLGEIRMALTSTKK